MEHNPFGTIATGSSMEREYNEILSMINTAHITEEKRQDLHFLINLSGFSPELEQDLLSRVNKKFGNL